MKKLSLLIATLLFFQFTSIGQNKWEAGAFIAPSISKIDEQQYSKYYDPIFPINYGIKINYNYKNFVFSSGFVHLTQGKKWILTYVGNDPEGSIGTVPQKIVISGLYIPFNVNYIFLNKKKISFLSGIGFFSGYIYSQKYHKIVGEEIEQIEYVDSLAFELNISLSFKYNFNETFCLTVTPNFLYQIRKNLHKIEPSHYGYTPKLWSGMLEIGFYYKFGKKEEKEEKVD